MIENFKKIHYFSTFDDDKLEQLCSFSTLEKLHKNEILFYEGDIPNKVFFLIDGKVKLSKDRGDLKQVFLHTFSSCSLIAEITMFEEMTYPATAQAVTDAEVIAVDLEKLKSEFLNDTDTLKMMVRSLASKIKFLMQTIEQEIATSSEVKVAKFLLKNVDNLKDYKNIEIAAILNIAPETFSRILTRFKKESILSSSKPIVIQDFNALRQMV